jgi:hypothetical protein
LNEPIGIAENYLGLIAAFRMRIAELGIPYETLDAIAGWTPTYASKLLAAEPERHMGVMAFHTILHALAVKIAVIPDPERLEKVRKHSQFSPRKYRVRAVGSQGYVAHRVTREHLQRIASEGGRARAEKLSERELSAIGRKAAKARWRKPRVVEVDGAKAT